MRINRACIRPYRVSADSRMSSRTSAPGSTPRITSIDSRKCGTWDARPVKLNSSSIYSSSTSQKKSLPFKLQNQDIHDASSELLMFASFTAFTKSQRTFKLEKERSDGYGRWNKGKQQVKSSRCSTCTVSTNATMKKKTVTAQSSTQTRVVKQQLHATSIQLQ